MAHRKHRQRRRRSNADPSKRERYATDERGRRKRLRKRENTGAVVNAEIKPRPLFPPRMLPYVDDEECSVCGELYHRTNLGVTWGEGEAAVRAANRAGPVAGSSGGFRSRGPVLWAMHAIKVERWYDRHVPCREYAGLKWPPGLVWCLVHGDRAAQIHAEGELVKRGLVDARQVSREAQEDLAQPYDEWDPDNPLF